MMYGSFMDGPPSKGQAHFKEIEKAALKELPAKKYLIPWHRVIRKMGDYGNYGEGRSRKKALSGWEAAKRSNI